jgi:hypothetical protein
MKKSNKELLDSFKVYYCPNSGRSYPVNNHPKTKLIKTLFQNKFNYTWYEGYECPICLWHWLEHELNEQTK